MPEPIKRMMARLKFPRMGMLAYQSKLVGKSQNRSETTWSLSQTALTALNNGCMENPLSLLSFFGRSLHSPRFQCTVNSIETQGKYAPAIENAARDKASLAAWKYDCFFGSRGCGSPAIIISNVKWSPTTDLPYNKVSICSIFVRNIFRDAIQLGVFI